MRMSILEFGKLRLRREESICDGTEPGASFLALPSASLNPRVSSSKQLP